MGRNEVLLAGRVSRLGVLKYTPSGHPLAEISLAVPQELLAKPSMGTVQVVLTGDAAETEFPKLRIGSYLRVEGKLWQRTYRTRKGERVNELKVIAHKIFLEERQNEQTGRREPSADRTL